MSCSSSSLLLLLRLLLLVLLRLMCRYTSATSSDDQLSETKEVPVTLSAFIYAFPSLSTEPSGPFTAAIATSSSLQNHAHKQCNVNDTLYSLSITAVLRHIHSEQAGLISPSKSLGYVPSGPYTSQGPDLQKNVRKIPNYTLNSS